VDKFVPAFLAGLETDLRPAYAQSLRQEGKAGSVGGPIDWWSRQAQAYPPVTHAFQAFDTGAGLHTQA